MYFNTTAVLSVGALATAGVADTPVATTIAFATAGVGLVLLAIRTIGRRLAAR